MSELMVLPPHVVEAAAQRERHKIRGHASQPGTGPAGQTCASCVSYRLVHYAKTYRKCLLSKPRWTGGPGTDIRASDPACSKWSPK